MLAQESFDQITNAIEDAVNKRPSGYWTEPLDVKELAKKSFEEGNCSYCDERSQNQIFCFLTGMTVPQYISRRLMMRVYKVLVGQDVLDQESLLNISGFSTTAALYKKFKTMFGMTLNEAFERKIDSLYEGQTKWDSLSNEGKGVFEKVVIKEIPVEIIVPDRKPYYRAIVVLAGIVLIAGVILWGYSYVKKWNGEYCSVININGAMMYDGHIVDYHVLSGKLDVKATEELPFDVPSIFSEMNIRWLKELSMLLGKVEKKGCCINCYNKNGVLVLKLIKKETFESWNQKWTGSYSVYLGQSNEGQYPIPNASVIIALQMGASMISIQESVQLPIYDYDETHIYLGENGNGTCLESMGDESARMEYHFTNEGEDTVVIMDIFKTYGYEEMSSMIEEILE